MTIGEKIKYFRVQKGITQEKIAQELYISYQAVSKWERNESLPDITVIAKLAKILGVSCDALLTENTVSVLNEINLLIENLKEKDLNSKISSLELAMEKYPNNELIIMELIQSYSKAIELPNWNIYRNNLINYGEYIVKNTSNFQYRYEATQLLCYVYRDIKEYEKIKNLAKSMPRLEQCKEALIYHSLYGDEHIEGMKNYAMKLIDTLESLSFAILKTEKAESLEKNFVTLREEILYNS